MPNPLKVFSLYIIVFIQNWQTWALEHSKMLQGARKGNCSCPHVAQKVLKKILYVLPLRVNKVVFRTSEVSARVSRTWFF